jgi:adenylate cyclase class 2
MLEIELKYPAADLEAVRGRLQAKGFVLAGSRREADAYFNAPDRDFARTDEALRVRTVGEQSVLTYKGPKQGAVGKTRLEVEVPLAPGTDAGTALPILLQHLGYRLTAIIRKQRQEYLHPALPITACVDEVEGVGSYVELEQLGEPERVQEVQAALVKLAADLGLTGESLRQSYLEQWLERHRQG